jgi:dipeptidyl aminopeptidase/acylaminoacyl peptidase
MYRVAVVLPLLLVSAATAATTAPRPRPAPVPARREVGALVLDGVPALTTARAERVAQYWSSRGAALWAWDLDGKGMLIGTRFGQTNQVHHVGAPMGDRQQLTFFEDQIAGAAYDPTRGSSGFYLVKDTGGDEFFQFYWYDRKSGKATLLTDGKSRNEGPMVHWRGGRYVYASTARNGRDFDIWLKEGDQAPRLIKACEGQWNPVSWSTDGKELLLEHHISVNENEIFLMDLATGALTRVDPRPAGQRVAYGQVAFSRDGKSIYLTSDEGSEWKRLLRLDRRTGKKTPVTPELGWDVSSFALSLDGKRLAYATNEAGRSAIYLGTTANPRGARRLTSLPGGVLGGFGFDWQSRRLGVSLATPTRPQDVYTIDVATGALTRWTQSETGGLDASTFVEPELIELTGHAGTKFSAWVYRPRLAAGQRAPVLVDIHGGPEFQSRATFNPFTQFLAVELGLAVVQPNVRGSTGYGKTFMTLDDGQKRMDAVKDIGTLLDWVAADPALDARRVCVYGSSYGGFMVLASLIAYPERVRCGVDMVGISHFVTFLENTQGYRQDLRRVEYGDERDPAMRKYLGDISPRTRAGDIRAPLLVVAGANDPRVPASEAQAITTAVREAGGVAWYILGTDEGHGFRKKANRDLLNAMIVQFLEQYLVSR